MHFCRDPAPIPRPVDFFQKSLCTYVCIFPLYDQFLGEKSHLILKTTVPKPKMPFLVRLRTISMNRGTYPMISEKTICRKSRSRSETLWFWIVMRRRGGEKLGTQSGGAAATRGQRAAEGSGGVDRRGRWARASAPALRAKAEGAMMRQLSVRPWAAFMVVKKQGNYLEAAVAHTKLKQSCSCCVVQRQGQRRNG